MRGHAMSPRTSSSLINMLIIFISLIVCSRHDARTRHYAPPPLFYAQRAMPRDDSAAQ